MFDRQHAKTAALRLTCISPSFNNNTHINTHNHPFYSSVSSLTSYSDHHLRRSKFSMDIFEYNEGKLLVARATKHCYCHPAWRPHPHTLCLFRPALQCVGQPVRCSKKRKRMPPQQLSSSLHLQ